MIAIHPTRIPELDLCRSFLGVGAVLWGLGVFDHRTIQPLSVVGEPLCACFRLPDGSGNALAARIVVS